MTTVNKATTEVTENVEVTSVFGLDGMSKSEMASTLAILTGMEGFEGQLEKLSIPAMRKMFDGLNRNGMAYNLAKQEARNDREHLKIAERRIQTLERDLKRARSKK